MAADPNPALRAELAAAIAVINPKIRGLQELLAVPFISEALAAHIRDELEADQRRLNLLHTVLARLDDVVDALVELEATGYPTVPPVTLPTPLLDELQAMLADLQQAAQIFSVQAARLSIAVTAVPKG